MRIAEIVLILIILLAAIMKISNIEGGDFISLVAYLTISFVYFFIYFLVNGKGIRKSVSEKTHLNYSTLHIVLICLTGIGLATVLTGHLFKILHWEGGDMQYFTGLGLSLASLLLFAVTGIKKQRGTTIRLGMRVFGWLLFTLIYRMVILK